MIEIRPCCAEDFNHIILLLRELWTDKNVDPALLRPVFERALLSKSKTCLCLTENTHVIGFGSLTIKDNLWPEGPLGYIDELIISSKHRSRGFGARLLSHLIEIAREKGCCRAELDSAFYRKDAHDFYEHEGFERRAYVYSKVL